VVSGVLGEDRPSIAASEAGVGVGGTIMGVPGWRGFTGVVFRVVILALGPTGLGTGLKDEL